MVHHLHNEENEVGSYCRQVPISFIAKVIGTGMYQACTFTARVIGTGRYQSDTFTAELGGTWPVRSYLG